MIRNGVIYKLAAHYYSPPCGLRVWLCFSLILPALGGRQSGVGVRRVEPCWCGTGDSERLHKQPPQNLCQVEPCRLEKHFSYFWFAPSTDGNAVILSVGTVLFNFRRALAPRVRHARPITGGVLQGIWDLLPQSGYCRYHRSCTSEAAWLPCVL